MILYISGPVTGREDRNLPAFRAAAERLKAAGYEVVLPHWNVKVGTEWHKAMRTCIRRMMLCDGVALLPDHAESEGSELEADVARQVGMPVMTVGAWCAKGVRDADVQG